MTTESIPSACSCRVKHGELTEKLRALEIGKQLDQPLPGGMHRTAIYQLARYAGIKIAVRKQRDGVHKVWRIA